MDTDLLYHQPFNIFHINFFNKKILLVLIENHPNQEYELNY